MLMVFLNLDLGSAARARCCRNVLTVRPGHSDGFEEDSEQDGVARRKAIHQVHDIQPALPTNTVTHQSCHRAGELT